MNYGKRDETEPSSQESKKSFPEELEIQMNSEDFRIREGTVQNSEKCLYIPHALPSWKLYFEKCEDIKPFTDYTDSFRIYSSGSEGPMCVFLHGAGHTSLSWGCVSKHLRQYARIFCYDCRGHGLTFCENESNLNVDRLVEDGIAIIKFLHRRLLSLEKSRNLAQDDSWKLEERLPIVLIGHSMGGAIAAHMAATQNIPSLRGLVILDVVEGTAMASLSHMENVIRNIPSNFDSPRGAIHWALSSGTLHNKESAELSIPSQLILSRKTASSDTRHSIPSDAETKERDSTWIWRTDLKKTRPFWAGWFSGMSKAFLQAKCAKILIGAGHDRLDKELMIAHMQGKFQLQLIQFSGHVIQEDQPQQVASILKNFILRYRLNNKANMHNTGKLF